MDGCCDHTRVIGHVCPECPTGHAEEPMNNTDENFADEIMGRDAWDEKRTVCTGNSMEMSDCFLHDQKCHHRGCEGLCKDEPEIQAELNEMDVCEKHGGPRGFCMDCANPSAELKRVRRELETTKAALDESDENFERIWDALVDCEQALVKERDAHGETRTSLKDTWEKLMRAETEISRCIRAFTTISSIAGDLLDEEKRLGPGMSGLQKATDGGGCLPDAAEEKEAR